LIVFSFFGRDIGSDVLDILFNAFINNFFSDNGIEKNVKFDDDLFEIVFLVRVLLCDEESILFF
jgi:hypothetical protein